MSEAPAGLHPATEYATPPDGYSWGYVTQPDESALVCNTCGAVVGAVQQHDTWHAGPASTPPPPPPPGNTP